MYRHGVGKLQLPQHVRRVGGRAVVEPDAHQFPGGVDVLHHAHVAVEDPRPGDPVPPDPQHIIIVPDLHHPVPGAEGQLPPHLLPLLRRGRIQRRLKGPVQRPGAPLPFPGGAQHLNLLRLDPHILRQPGLAQLHHQIHRRQGVPAAHKEEIASGGVPQLRNLPLVDRVGRPDDG